MSVEILAPGGSVDGIYAAMLHGADAIYTGTQRFSARAFADNPSVEQLCDILDFAHVRDKKIYLTVNTLLTDEELEDHLYDLLLPLYDNGLDAVIVQDIGVMQFIHEAFPALDIHASTQMTIVTADGANQWKPYGVTRVVPARELSIGEIAQMRKHTDLEMEVFVHGALCYCYSGQCMMSRSIGGRSGNRGMCAQPCRLPYRLSSGKTGYYLSPKDMCTLGQVGELMDAGVDSFKIEGRMKKLEYAAMTARLYRMYADAHEAGIRPNDKELEKDVKKLMDLYNRGGFCKGYLFEKDKKEIIYKDKNGHYGVEVGTVLRVKKGEVVYRLTEEISYQDVLEFRDAKGEKLYEYTVKNGCVPPAEVTARYQKGCVIKPGQKVFRTKNAALLQEIDAAVEQEKKEDKLPVQGTFQAEIGKEMRLQLSCGAVSCEVTGIQAEPAKGKAVSAEDVRKRLHKTGESEFTFSSLEVSVEEGAFLPLGQIAALRRDGFAELGQKLKEKQLEKRRKIPAKRPETPASSSFSAPLAVSMMIGTFEYCRISRHTCQPSIFGIMTSKMIKSISFSARNTSTASSPSAASSTVKFSLTKKSFTSFRILCSSSTTRIFCSICIPSIQSIFAFLQFFFPCFVFVDQFLLRFFLIGKYGILTFIFNDKQCHNENNEHCNHNLTFFVECFLCLIQYFPFFFFCF